MKRFNTDNLSQRAIPYVSAQMKREIAAINPVQDAALQSEIYNRVSKLTVEELKIQDWNGFVELTDECKFGLALFEIRSDYVSTTVQIPLKESTVTRDTRNFATQSA